MNRSIDMFTSIGGSEETMFGPEKRAHIGNL